MFFQELTFEYVADNRQLLQSLPCQFTQSKASSGISSAGRRVRRRSDASANQTPQRRSSSSQFSITRHVSSRLYSPSRSGRARLPTDSSPTGANNRFLLPKYIHVHQLLAYLAKNHTQEEVVKCPTKKPPRCPLSTLLYSTKNITEES